MSWYRGLEAWVREGVSLAPLTFYKVGGPAQYFAEPSGEEGLRAILRGAGEAELPIHILGDGSNLLVGDRGVEGLVLRLPKRAFSQRQLLGERLEIGAGHGLPSLVNWCTARGLSGLECLAGVPGTVGAALRMNAGGKYGEIGVRVESVEGVELDGRPFQWKGSACGFKYRDSGLQDRVVTRAVLALEASPPEEIRARVRSILEEKQRSQPLWVRSAGCVFKNPAQPGVAPAGKIIDELGMKGWQEGGARISERHANFLVCVGRARASDVAALIRRIRGRVWAERGVALQLEIAVWGLSPDELSSGAA